jgi:2-polyprenyl-3-methyl-5-hydroxy-6-metoxy-1,4-benzoquinol methylase
MVEQILDDPITQERDAFLERMLASAGGLFEIFTVYIGDRLDLYRALAEHSPMTSIQLANATRTQERYVREWLEQQTVTGILQVENATAPALERRFIIPSSRVEVLVERDSLNYLAPLAQLAVGAVSPIHSVLDAFRNGGGVPYADYGADLVEGQGAINRAMYLQELGQAWLPSIPDVHAKLLEGGKIADFGCGVGWSSIGMAQAYPNAQVDGFDLDRLSIEQARHHAADARLNGRLTFHLRDAGDPSLAGQYDLVTAFECVHDMSNPVAALRTMRHLAGENGAVIIADERVGDAFTPEGNDVEWMMYGWSVLHCLPVGMADEPSVGTGTVMRADTLRDYAEQAGFSRVEVLPIDNFFFRVYRLIV